MRCRRLRPDVNCRKIAAWTPQGTFIGKLSFSPLLGVRNPLPQDMWVAPDEAYVAIRAEAKTKDRDHVVLFRVLGL